MLLAIEANAAIITRRVSVEFGISHSNVVCDLQDIGKSIRSDLMLPKYCKTIRLSWYFWIFLFLASQKISLKMIKPSLKLSKIIKFVISFLGYATFILSVFTWFPILYLYVISYMDCLEGAYKLVLTLFRRKVKHAIFGEHEPHSFCVGGEGKRSHWLRAPGEPHSATIHAIQ